MQTFRTLPSLTLQTMSPDLLNLFKPADLSFAGSGPTEKVKLRILKTAGGPLNCWQRWPRKGNSVVFEYRGLCRPQMIITNTIIIHCKIISIHF